MPEKPNAPTLDRAMHHLGQTRSAVRKDHALLTPDTFVRAPLPGMKNAMAIVHTAPAIGAAFTQYTAELDAGGSLGPAEAQRFVFVLEGETQIQSAGKNQTLAKGGYAYTPSGSASNVCSAAACRIAVIEKAYQSLVLEGVRSPEALIGNEGAIAAQPLMNDESLGVRALLPDDPAFDFRRKYDDVSTRRGAGHG